MDFFWAAFLELPIRPKIDFPYWKLGWGTLCSFYFVILALFCLTILHTFQNRWVKWRVNLICTWMVTNILAGVGWFYPLKGLKFVSFRLSTRWEVRSLAPQWPFFLDNVQKLWGFFTLWLEVHQIIIQILIFVICGT